MKPLQHHEQLPTRDKYWRLSRIVSCTKIRRCFSAEKEDYNRWKFVKVNYLRPRPVNIHSGANGRSDAGSSEEENAFYDDTETVHYANEVAVLRDELRAARRKLDAGRGLGQEKGPSQKITGG